MSAAVQYYTGAEIDLVHCAVDPKVVFRSLEDDQEGAHENDTGELKAKRLKEASLIESFFFTAEGEASERARIQVSADHAQPGATLRDRRAAQGGVAGRHRGRRQRNQAGHFGVPVRVGRNSQGQRNEYDHCVRTGCRRQKEPPEGAATDEGFQFGAAGCRAGHGSAAAGRRVLRHIPAAAERQRGGRTQRCRRQYGRCQRGLLRYDDVRGCDECGRRAATTQSHVLDAAVLVVAVVVQRVDGQHWQTVEVELEAAQSARHWRRKRWRWRSVECTVVA